MCQDRLMTGMISVDFKSPNSDSCVRLISGHCGVALLYTADFCLLHIQIRAE